VSHFPVDPRDFPDPFVLNTDAGFYAYATNGGGANVQVLTSPDLLTWDGAPDALPALAAWAQKGHTWAPSVVPWNGAYALFYACREPNAGRQAISVATSAHPGGPFIDTSSGPLVYQLDRGGSIDPSPFVDTDGMAYLVWKADSNAINQPSSIWLQPIGPNGTTLAGAPTELLGYGARGRTRSSRRPPSSRPEAPISCSIRRTGGTPTATPSATPPPPPWPAPTPR
jgi:beta-xylosidase